MFCTTHHIRLDRGECWRGRAKTWLAGRRNEALGCPRVQPARPGAGLFAYLTDQVRPMAESQRQRPPENAAPTATPFPAPVSDRGLSLDQLSSAFAEMFQHGDEPYESAPHAGGPPAAATQAVTAQGQGDEQCELSPRSIIEALLFVGRGDGQPLTCEQLSGLMRGVRAAEVEELIQELNALYAAQRRPYRIVGSGPGFALTLLPDWQGVADRLRGKQRQARLSLAAIEALSIVAYEQPISGEEIQRLRGVSSAGVLAQLVRRQLLRAERTAEQPRQLIYSTTDRFLQFFGLASLADLPRREELLPR